MTNEDIRKKYENMGILPLGKGVKNKKEAFEQGARLAEGFQKGAEQIATETEAIRELIPKITQR